MSDHVTVSKRDIGIRTDAGWIKYAEPFKFNIIVNDMKDVIAHKDIGLAKRQNFGIQSSTGEWGFRTSFEYRKGLPT